MRLTLQVQSGPDAPRSFAIEPGPAVQVGRTPPAQVMLGGDPTVSRRHFALTFDGQSCHIRDLSSTHGTLVNDLAVTEAVLNDGDVIQAGGTVLRVHLGEDHPALSAMPLVVQTPAATGAATKMATETLMEIPVVGPNLHDRVIQTLRAQNEPLYAILDAARDSVVLARLFESNEQYQSLYEGPRAQQYAAFAPYLVSLPAEFELTRSTRPRGLGTELGRLSDVRQAVRRGQEAPPAFLDRRAGGVQAGEVPVPLL